MNREEFLTVFRQSLKELPEQERNEIISDYEEHFSIGLEKGKTETEICSALGDPSFIANQFKVGYMIKQVEEKKTPSNILRLIFTAFSLGFVNLFFLLIPFIMIIVTLISLFAVASAITLAGLASLFVLVIPGLSPIHLLPLTAVGSGIFLAIGIVTMGLLLIIGLFYLTKLFFSGTISYLKWNIKIINLK